MNLLEIFISSSFIGPFAFIGLGYIGSLIIGPNKLSRNSGEWRNKLSPPFRYPIFVILYITLSVLILASYQLKLISPITTLRSSIFNLGMLLSGFSILWTIRFINERKLPISNLFQHPETAYLSIEKLLSEDFWKPGGFRLLSGIMIPIAVGVELFGEDTLNSPFIGIFILTITVALSTSACALALILVTRLYKFIVEICTDSRNGIRPNQGVRQIGKILNQTALFSLTILTVYTLTAFCRPENSPETLWGILIFALPAGATLLALFMLSQLRIHRFLADVIDTKIQQVELDLDTITFPSPNTKHPENNYLERGVYLQSEIGRLQSIPVWPSSWKGIVTAVVYWLSTTLGITTAVIQLLTLAKN